MAFEQCIYWGKCIQKKRGICTSGYEHCTIFGRMRSVDKEETPTGIERFKRKYGPTWRQVAFGEQTINPTRIRSTLNKLLQEDLRDY